MADSIFDVFANARAKRDTDYAANNTKEAQEGIADQTAQNARVSSAIKSMGNSRPVGGGRFGNLSGSRRGVRLGALTANGLATANRTKLKEARRKQADTEYTATRRAKAQSNYGMTSAEADAALSPQGLRHTQTFRGRTQTTVTRIDDGGRRNTEYL